MVAAQGDWRKPSYYYSKGVFDIPMENNTNIAYDKPFKTYEEMLSLMSSRNIIISNPAFAKKVLAELSYYTIVNGYKNTFLSIPGSDNFIEGTTFEQLYTLHNIDINLHNIIFKNILFIERYLKTRISYLVSQKYGVYTDKNDLSNMNPNDYLCRDYYLSRNGRNNILKSIKKTLLSDNLNPSIAHYANDKNHIPAWILVTALTFGLSIKWYSILKSDDKTDICNQFLDSSDISIDSKKEFLTVSFSLLREYRNKIAHGNRTFNLQHLPILPKQQLIILSHNAISSNEYNRGMGQTNLFAVILICFILIDDQYILSNFLRDLNYVLDPYKNTQLNQKTIFEIFGLPNNIIARLTKFHSDKFS